MVLSSTLTTYFLPITPCGGKAKSLKDHNGSYFLFGSLIKVGLDLMKRRQKFSPFNLADVFNPVICNVTIKKNPAGPQMFQSLLVGLKSSRRPSPLKNHFVVVVTFRINLVLVIKKVHFEKPCFNLNTNGRHSYL